MAIRSSRSRTQATDPTTWVERYGDVLFKYAVARVSQHDEAEDLVQEVLLAGLKARAKFDGNSSEQTWLLSILRHKIADYFRKRYREDVHDSVGVDSIEKVEARGEFDRRGRWKRPPARWPGSPAETFENREFWLTLERCLDNLPPALGESFRLREMEQMGMNEVCAAMGIGAANLRVRLCRARSLLRRCLELHWFADSP